MDNIEFNSFIQVVDTFNNSEKIGSGYEGTCYKINNKTYKLYNSLYCNIYNNFKSINELLRFKDIFIDNVYFIRSLIYYDNLLIGSISDYAVGKSCSKIYLHRRKLDRLIVALYNLKNTVFELSKLKICINDFFLSNILYDGYNFKLIDTGSYCYSEFSNNYDNDLVLSIYRSNMEVIMKNLFINITCKYSDIDNFIYLFLQDINSCYKDYLIDVDLMINPDDTIVGIRKEIEEYIGYECDTFSSCRKDLLRVRKIL